jgi:hypothetical protein
VVNELRRSAAGRIGQCTTGTGIAHPFDEGIHLRPMVLKTQAMKGAVGVQVSANGIGMKGDKNNII